MRKFILFNIILVVILASCTNSQPEYSEDTFTISDTNDSFVVRSYPHLDMDSVWRYSIDEQIVAIYTSDSTGNCKGRAELRFFTGELHGYGKCVDGFYDGMWKFYRKTGELHFINVYSMGFLCQRWVVKEGDTSKWLYPIISIEPRTAYINDTIFVRVDYNLNGIDTTGWDFFLHYDFTKREKFDSQESLPYEEFTERYDGKPIEVRFAFPQPGKIAMYGYTLAINRVTGDTIMHMEIMDQFFTILDSTSVEL